MSFIEIFAHRGSGVTDIGPQGDPDAKGDGLKDLPPENSEEAQSILRVHAPGLLPAERTIGRAVSARVGPKVP